MIETTWEPADMSVHWFYIAVTFTVIDEAIFRMCLLILSFFLRAKAATAFSAS